MTDFTDFANNLGDIRVLGEDFNANLDGEMLLPSGKLLFWTFGWDLVALGELIDLSEVDTKDEADEETDGEDWGFILILDGTGFRDLALREFSDAEWVEDSLNLGLTLAWLSIPILSRSSRSGRSWSSLAEFGCKIAYFLQPSTLQVILMSASYWQDVDCMLEWAYSTLIKCKERRFKAKTFPQWNHLVRNHLSLP